MDNEQKIEVLTDQPVVIKLGGKEYKARRASLYDLGLLNKYIREKTKQGDDANLDLDSSVYIICELMKEIDPNVPTPEQLAKSLPPFEGLLEVREALKVLGFKVPQSLVGEILKAQQP